MPDETSSNTENGSQVPVAPSDVGTTGVQEKSLHSSWESISSEAPGGKRGGGGRRGRGRNQNRPRGNRRVGGAPQRGGGTGRSSEPSMIGGGQNSPGSVVSLLDLPFDDSSQLGTASAGQQPSGRDKWRGPGRVPRNQEHHYRSSPQYRGPEEFNNNAGQGGGGYDGNMGENYRGNMGGIYRGQRGGYNMDNRGGNNRGDYYSGNQYRGNQYRGYRGESGMGYRGDNEEGRRDYGVEHGGARGGRVNYSRSLEHNEQDSGQPVGVRDLAQSVPFPFCKEVAIQNEVKDEKCLLLIIMNKEICGQDGCRIQVDKKTHVVKVSGMDETTLDNTIGYIYRLLVDMYSEPVEVSRGLAERLASKQGIGWVMTFFRKQELHAIYYLDTNKSAKVISFDEDSAEKAAGQLFTQLQTEKVPYNQSNAEYLNSEKWRKYVESTQKSYLVVVEVIPTSFMVSVEGVRNEEFNLAVSAVKSQLAGNQTSAEELRIVESQLRLLQLNVKSLT